LSLVAPWPQIVSVRHRRREEMMDDMTFIVQYHLKQRVLMLADQLRDCRFMLIIQV